MSLRAGVGKVNFQIQAGQLMAAFPRRPAKNRTGLGALDDLGVRCVLLTDGETTVALCSVDLCMVRDVSVDRVRDTVNDRIPEITKVLFAATHTHAGPETSFLFGGTPEDREVRRIESDIVEAIEMAHADTTSVDVSWGAVDLPLVYNRRVTNSDGRSEMIVEYKEGVTTGPADPSLQVVRFDRGDGTPLVAFCHYTAHALTLGPGNDYFSSDYPGRVRDCIEEAYSGCTAFFLNGAAGNVHLHRCMRADSEALDEMGEAIGEKAVEALGGARRIHEQTGDGDGQPRIRLLSDTVTFENRMDASLRVPVEIDLLNIGGLRLAFLPGEFFVEFQLAFNKRMRPGPAIFVGYANAWPGYVPTTEAYETGGYGVDAATQDPPRWSRTALPRGAGEQILERLFELADSL